MQNTVWSICLAYVCGILSCGILTCRILTGLRLAQWHFVYESRFIYCPKRSMKFVFSLNFIFCWVIDIWYVYIMASSSFSLSAVTGSFNVIRLPKQICLADDMMSRPEDVLIASHCFFYFVPCWKWCSLLSTLYYRV